MKHVATLIFVISSLGRAVDEPIKVNGLAQAWMFNDTSVTAAKPNFRLRRGEIKVSGTVSDQVKAFVMIDAAKAIATSTSTVSTPTSTTTVSGVNTSGDTKILQDLGVTVTPMDGLEVTLGQVKTPTTSEGLDPSYELIFPERSLVARTYGDKREPGMVIGYKTHGVKTTMMISNGQATNVDDVDNNKDLTLRITGDLTSDLSAGVFTQAANFSYGERARHGANFKYQTEAVLARLEGVYQSQNQDTLKSYGAVVDGGYRIDKWQPTVRYEIYTPDSSGSQNGKAVSLGLNYHFTPKAKAQFATTVFWDLNANNGALGFSAAANGTTGTLMALAFSAAL